MFPRAYRTLPSNYDPGKKLFTWRAFDYHPHERGIVWYSVFCFIVFGSAAWAIYTDPKTGWLAAFTILVFAAAYFWTHRKAYETHDILVYEKVLQIDELYYLLEQFAGYWFVYGPEVAVINFELKSGKFQKEGRKVSLQMGPTPIEFFREHFELIGFPELDDRKESLLDLWLRVLKV